MPIERKMSFGTDAVSVTITVSAMEYLENSETEKHIEHMLDAKLYAARIALSPERLKEVFGR